MFRAGRQQDSGTCAKPDHCHPSPEQALAGEFIQWEVLIPTTKLTIHSQNVLVVGGFGASEYLFQQIKLHVPPQFQNKVVRPIDSVAAIVKGAVTAGITERVITSRVARRHYLMATLQPFKEGHHPEQYRVPSLDGKDRCKYTRQIFVQKGQRVKIGEPVKVSFFRQVAPGATLMYENVLYACDEDVCPEYTKDPRKS